jgi:hypothetical protein
LLKLALISITSALLVYFAVTRTFPSIFTRSVIVGEYLRVDQANLYFAPAAPTN